MDRSRGETGRDGQLPVYVISRGSAAGRWENVSRAFDAMGLPCVRFEAVDGDNLTSGQLGRYTGRGNNFRWQYGLSLPEIGCYLSHLRLWEEVSRGSHEGAFVFEDDAVPLPGLASVLGTLSTMVLDAPTVVKLERLLGEPETRPRLVRRRPLGNGYDLAEPRHVPHGTGAYYVNRRAAARLAARRRTFFRPVDEDLRYYWETGVRVMLVLPAVVCNPPAQADSTINQSRGESRARRRSSWTGRLVFKLWLWYPAVVNAACVWCRTLTAREP